MLECAGPLSILTHTASRVSPKRLAILSQQRLAHVGGTRIARLPRRAIGDRSATPAVTRHTEKLRRMHMKSFGLEEETDVLGLEDIDPSELMGLGEEDDEESTEMVGLEDDEEYSGLGDEEEEEEDEGEEEHEPTLRRPGLRLALRARRRARLLTVAAIRARRKARIALRAGLRARIRARLLQKAAMKARRRARFIKKAAVASKLQAR
jgi:hypothetical protein